MLTSKSMLGEVDRAWARSPETRAAIPDQHAADEPALLGAKLDAIVLPAVQFNGMPLGQVVTTLSVASQEYDRDASDPRGVNIVLINPGGGMPAVSLTLRNLTLRRVLDLVTESVGFQYEVQADAVVVRPGGEVTALATRFYPVSRSTVLRLTARMRPEPNPTSILWRQRNRSRTKAG